MSRVVERIRMDIDSGMWKVRLVNLCVPLLYIAVFLIASRISTAVQFESLRLLIIVAVSVWIIGCAVQQILILIGVYTNGYGYYLVGTVLLLLIAFVDVCSLLIMSRVVGGFSLIGLSPLWLLSIIFMIPRSFVFCWRFLIATSYCSKR